jgi:hypothetical protein
MTTLGSSDLNLAISVSEIKSSSFTDITEIIVLSTVILAIFPSSHNESPVKSTAKKDLTGGSHAVAVRPF